MGFFSWLTQDTNRSISNIYSSRPFFCVFMLDHLGNNWKENYYEGYGVFGGKDYYNLMAEMNGLESREKTIDLYFNPNPSIIFPNLVEYPHKWKWKNEKPKDCPNQGYFY
ncbi:MAG: hypothetical protein KGY51_03725 [Psychroflexus sp.]|nr:hypothetical protein [Psychroflexus sp.]